jgi:hypothetical protein
MGDAKITLAMSEKNVGVIREFSLKENHMFLKKFLMSPVWASTAMSANPDNRSAEVIAEYDNDPASSLIREAEFFPGFRNIL